jgi:hypothetical protein
MELSSVIGICIIVAAGLTHKYNSKLLNESEANLNSENVALREEINKIRNTLTGESTSWRGKYEESQANLQKSREELAAQIAKLLQVRKETCLALDAEITDGSYNQKKCMTERQMKSIVELLNSTSATVIEGITTYFLTRIPTEYRKNFELLLDAIKMLDKYLLIGVQKLDSPEINEFLLRMAEENCSGYIANKQMYISAFKEDDLYIDSLFAICKVYMIYEQMPASQANSIVKYQGSNSFGAPYMLQGFEPRSEFVYFRHGRWVPEEYVERNSPIAVGGAAFNKIVNYTKDQQYVKGDKNIVGKQIVCSGRPEWITMLEKQGVVISNADIRVMKTIIRAIINAQFDFADTLCNMKSKEERLNFIKKGFIDLAATYTRAKNSLMIFLASSYPGVTQ